MGQHFQVKEKVGICFPLKKHEDTAATSSDRHPGGCRQLTCSMLTSARQPSSPVAVQSRPPQVPRPAWGHGALHSPAGGFSRSKFSPQPSPAAALQTHCLSDNRRHGACKHSVQLVSGSHSEHKDTGFHTRQAPGARSGTRELHYQCRKVPAPPRGPAPISWHLGSEPATNTCLSLILLFE